MQSTGHGLDYILDEGGSNLSVGEKQLLCLGSVTLHFHALTNRWLFSSTNKRQVE